MQYYKLFDGDTAVKTSNSMRILTDTAENLLSELPEDEKKTYLIRKLEGRPVGSISNRRIIGLYKKQEWDGNDYAILVGEVEFDATDVVLNLPLDDIREMADNSEDSDNVGNQCVEWHGPHVVHIEDAIMEYFGVEDLSEITEELLVFAREREKPKQKIVETMTLTVKLNVLMSEQEDEEARQQLLSEVVENLDYDFTSNTPGAIIQSTEITDC
jgi:hypothetical protein